MGPLTRAEKISAGRILMGDSGIDISRRLGFDVAVQLGIYWMMASNSQIGWWRRE